MALLCSSNCSASSPFATCGLSAHTDHRRRHIRVFRAPPQRSPKQQSSFAMNYLSHCHILINSLIESHIKGPCIHRERETLRTAHAANCTKRMRSHRAGRKRRTRQKANNLFRSSINQPILKFNFIKSAKAKFITMYGSHRGLAAYVDGV